MDNLNLKDVLKSIAITTVAVLIAFKVKEMLDKAKTVPPQKAES